LDEQLCEAGKTPWPGEKIYEIRTRRLSLKQFDQNQGWGKLTQLRIASMKEVATF